MSHYQVAHEMMECLRFSPGIRAQGEPQEAIGESFFRVIGQDGAPYGVLVRRMNETKVDVTGEILVQVMPEQQPD